MEGDTLSVLYSLQLKFNSKSLFQTPLLFQPEQSHHQLTAVFQPVNCHHDKSLAMTWLHNYGVSRHDSSTLSIVA